MKIPWLCSFAMLCASTVLAQTTPAPAPAAAPMISITGCVAGGSSSKPITLTNAMVLPYGSPAVGPDTSGVAATDASTSPLPERPAVSAGATQPNTTNPAAPATPTSPTAGATSSIGTIDTGSA